MKLWTINTHSISEADYERKLVEFADAAAKHRPDIIAMQEVNQLHTGPDTGAHEDNHALRAVRLIEERGVCYYWCWLPVKLGFGKYDEGLAILSLSPIAEKEEILISRSSDYFNWKTRKILGVRCEGSSEWFYNVHMGWWDDDEEPFSEHWKRLSERVKGKSCWLMGDFNSRADARGGGYDLVRSSGFYDTFELAEERDGGATVIKSIDGWKGNTDAMRLDYIFTSEKQRIKKSRVIFNGGELPVISDHFGVEVCF